MVERSLSIRTTSAKGPGFDSQPVHIFFHFGPKQSKLFVAGVCLFLPPLSLVIVISKHRRVSMMPQRHPISPVVPSQTWRVAVANHGHQGWWGAEMAQWGYPPRPDQTGDHRTKGCSEPGYVRKAVCGDWVRWRLTRHGPFMTWGAMMEGRDSYDRGCI